MQSRQKSTKRIIGLIAIVALAAALVHVAECDHPECPLYSTLQASLIIVAAIPAIATVILFLIALTTERFSRTLQLNSCAPRAPPL
ncbi:MAG: hypothetical protein R3F48_03180 [Candidatus Zixiibacteriota bacterium]